MKDKEKEIIDFLNDNQINEMFLNNISPIKKEMIISKKYLELKKIYNNITFDDIKNSCFIQLFIKIVNTSINICYLMTINMNKDEKIYKLPKKLNWYITKKIYLIKLNYYLLKTDINTYIYKDNDNYYFKLKKSRKTTLN